MTAPCRLHACLVALAVTTTACDRQKSVQQSAPVKWWVSTNSPAVSVWDGGGLPMIGKPPSVVFALWSDGLIVRSVGGRLQKGRVQPQAISTLMTEVEAAGFFSPPVPYGLVHPDAPVRVIAVMRNGELVRLSYDGDNDFRDVGPSAYPSRSQLESFVQMWERVMRAIDIVPSGPLSNFQGERELKYPR